MIEEFTAFVVGQCNGHCVRVDEESDDLQWRTIHLLWFIVRKPELVPEQ
jgi:hypothetical protein